MKHTLTLLVLLSALLNACATTQPQAPTDMDHNPQADNWITIHNDFVWTTDQGEFIFTRSGCLTQFDGVYYWYGSKRPGGFQEQYCYTSTDLVHWENQGVIYRDNVEINRIDVLFNKKLNKYVLIMKYDGNGAHFATATADTPTGPFTFREKMLIDDALMGDMSIYQDDDGTAYLCYVSWAKSVNGQHGIYRLSDDYLQPEQRIYLWDIGAREAPHIFKRNGIYYYGTSETAWIDSSETRYYTAKNLAGPWSPPPAPSHPRLQQLMGHPGRLRLPHPRHRYHHLPLRR